VHGSRLLRPARGGQAVPLLAMTILFIFSFNFWHYQLLGIFTVLNSITLF
jgi:hypothetical protein